MTEEVRRGMSTGAGEDENLLLPDDDDLIVVRTPAEQVQFHGRLIAHVSTRSEGRPRWTELDLYRVVDSATVSYAQVNRGMSVVYHGPGSSCNTGIPRRIRDLTDEEFSELAPCTVCRPADLDDLPDDSVVNAETERNGVIEARDAAEMVHRLRNRDWRNSQGGEEYSSPAERLLRLAAEQDEGIRNEITRVRHL